MWLIISKVKKIPIWMITIKKYIIRVDKRSTSENLVLLLQFIISKMGVSSYDKLWCQ